ncbi:MAG: 2OG-Fe(II) oxygenase [Nostoc sp.]|uniref:2OG-Fe(II) oxygenase n=1 Tax=Nostoc sp. TaxID=1180 RepID=UPI002FF3EF2C
MNTFVKKALNRIIESFLQIHFFSNKAELTYQAAIEKHVDNLPFLSSNDMTIVEALRSEGIVITSLTALLIPSTLQMLQATKGLIPKISQSIYRNKTEYAIHANPKQIIEYREIFDWGLEQRLLNIIENYLGLPVAYLHPSFRRDIANQVQRNTRLWHLDKEDRKVVKIIVYLNDVNDDGGPFQYIPLSFTPTVTRSLRYNYGYIQNQTMQQVISPSNFKSCTGSSGTVIIADTAKIFHRGKIPIDSDRFAIFFEYTSRFPKYPFYCKRSLTNENLLILATKLSENQRRCIFWRL